MPYNPNANWTARTNANAKSPVYYVAVEGVTSKHWSTGPVRSAATTKKPFLRVPQSIGQRLAQLQGKSTVNISDIEIVDRDGDITDLIATEKASPTVPTLVNRRMTLYSGYADLVEADYAPVALGQIRNVSLLEDNLTYRFELGDLKRHQFDDIFTNAGANGSVAMNVKLSNPALTGTRTLQATPNVVGFSAGDNIYIGPSGSGFEDAQTIAVVRTDENLVVLRDVLRHDYAAGDSLRWGSTVIEGNPINIFYSILTGNFSKTGSFPLLTILGVPSGLGISLSDIDLTALGKERDFMSPSEIWRFEIKEKTSGFKFLEQFIYKWLGYPYTTIPGLIGFRTFRPWFAADAAAGLPSISKAEILAWRWARAHPLHVNRVRVGLDTDPVSRKPRDFTTVEDTADQTATKETPVIEDADTGFQRSFDGVRLTELRGRGLLRRFLKPPAQISLTLPLTKRALQIGEVIQLTHSDIPNEKTGTRGTTNRRMEIIERTERFSDDLVELLVQDAGFNRPGAIAPDTQQALYTSATAAEKEYAYIAPDVGNFGDGGSPYEIV